MRILSSILVLTIINSLFIFSLYSNANYSDYFTKVIYVDKQEKSKVQPLNAKASKRIALIIGNSNYSQETFINAVNDAKLMKETLEKVNFDVTILIDSKYGEITNIIDTFLNKLQDDKSLTGLLYFTGDGIQVDGRNYFIPVDKAVKSIDDVWTNTVSIHDILERFDRIKNHLNIVILDMPRRKLFSTGYGLNIDFYFPDETFIIYSCSPGLRPIQNNEGINSTFAIELSKAIVLEKIDLSMIDKIVRGEVYNKTNKKQVIWSSSSLSEKFYFKE